MIQAFVNAGTSDDVILHLTQESLDAVKAGVGSCRGNKIQIYTLVADNYRC